MLSLYLLTVVGLVVVAATDPHDFSRLCSSPAPGGECPAGWKNVGGDCVKFMSGWDQAKTKEVCKEEGAELTSFGLVGEACLVRRETQCQCGRTNRDREANIVGGGPAERNEYPWQVRLSSGCGGSIISRDKILTAAHCTEGHPVERITVFTRDHDRTREDGEVSHSVCSKREHPDYNREAKYDKDIAILTLCKPLMFTEAVGPICLPDPAQDYDNVKALVTGWGRLRSGGQLPDILQEVNVTTMTNQKCRGKYGHSRITDYMICAGNVGRDSCQGDSGGPLSVLGQDDRYSQIGIVSWGEGCAKPGYPGVYTRLTTFFAFWPPDLGITCPCPAGWSQFGEDCYKYFDNSVEWEEARERCLSEKADLASIHSEEEHDFLLEIIGNAKRVWVGGRRSCSGCEDFEWSDGTPLDFTAWHRV